MRHKTLFRNLCKLLGIYFVVIGLAGMFNNGVYLIAVLASSGYGTGPYGTWFYLINLAGPVFQIAAGIYFFFGARFIVNLAIPSNRPYCPECGYDLTGAVGDICPECGVHRHLGRAE